MMEQDKIRVKLMKFLDTAPVRPFEYGQSDCMLEILDWIDYCCGTKIAVRYRGYYDSEKTAAKIYGKDFVAGLRKLGEHEGLKETDDPQPGDFALVKIGGNDPVLGAIMLYSGRWRMKVQSRDEYRARNKLPDYVITREVEVVTAWELPCRQS